MRENILVAGQYLLFRVSEKYHETRLGIKTAGYHRLTPFGYEEQGSDASAYEPISYRSLFKALKRIRPDPARDVFIDYGSGKGRAVIAAATLSFKHVIGVELLEPLTQLARENVERAAGRIRCQKIDLITLDAAEYEPSDEITVALFYNPFPALIMKEVISKLKESLERKPRRLWAIIKHPDWADDPFEKDAQWKIFWQERGYSKTGEVLKVYKAALPV